jgi:hypothetical protein
MLATRELFHGVIMGTEERHILIFRSLVHIWVNFEQFASQSLDCSGAGVLVLLIEPKPEDPNFVLGSSPNENRGLA